MRPSAPAPDSVPDSAPDSAPTRRASTPKIASETAVSVVFFGALWLFWGVRYADFLFASQDVSFFVFRPDFFARVADGVGGALDYSTAFVVQFFYRPWLGGAILAGLGVGLQVAVARTANLRGPAYVASLLPTSLLTVAATWNAYYIYNQFHFSIVFSGVLGALASLGVLAVYRRIGPPLVRLAFAVVLGALAYPGFAFWAVFALVLCAFDEGTNPSESPKARSIRAAVLFFAAVAIPPAEYWAFLFPKVDLAVLFSTGLIDDVRGSKDVLVATFACGGAIAAPVVLALLFLTARLSALAALRPKRKTTRRARRESARIAKSAKTVKSAKISESAKTAESTEGVQTAEAPRTSPFAQSPESRRTRLVWELTFVVLAATLAASYRAEPFFAILAENRALVDGDWARILEIDARTRRPIEHSVALRNLAFFETGELAERAFERPIAGISTIGLTFADFERAQNGELGARWKVWRFRQRRQTQSAALNSTSELIMSRFGQTGVAARCAMNKLAGCDGRSVSALRALAICAEIDGEGKLARRYLTEVAQTLYWRRWANVRLAYLASPDFRRGVRDFFDDPERNANLANPNISSTNPTNPENPANPTSGGVAASVEEAAARYGVDPTEVAAVASEVEKARKLRPLVDRKELDAFPDLARLYGVFSDDFDKASRDVQELELIAALYQKGSFAVANDGFFLRNVEKYRAARPNERLPKAIEEGFAALRFAKFGDDWAKTDYRFSPETTAKFAEFADFARRRNGDLTSPDSQEAIRACCAGTYWGYSNDLSAFLRF